MSTLLTGITDLDNIINDYKECMEAFDHHKLKYKNVMKELKYKSYSQIAHDSWFPYMISHGRRFPKDAFKEKNIKPSFFKTFHLDFYPNRIKDDIKVIQLKRLKDMTCRMELHFFKRRERF